MEYHSAIKKNEAMPFYSHMDGPRDYRGKQNRSERERQIHDITCMWNLKYDTNELIYKTETNTDTGNRLVVAKVEGGWGKDGFRVWG